MKIASIFNYLGINAKWLLVGSHKQMNLLVGVEQCLDAIGPLCFMFQKPFLPPQFSAIAHQLTIGSDYPVTGNNNT
jgi:hypothetical protein